MSSNPLRHAMARMGGRDPHEAHRAATPLELFFDLTFAPVVEKIAALCPQVRGWVAPSTT